MANMALPPVSKLASTITLSDTSDVECIVLVSAVEGGAKTIFGTAGNPLQIGDAGGSLTVDSTGIKALGENINLSNGVIVSYSSSSAQIIAANSGARERIVKNLDPSDTVYVGATGVTATTGFPIGPGASGVFSCNNAMFAISLGAGSLYIAELVAV